VAAGELAGIRAVAAKIRAARARLALTLWAVVQVAVGSAWVRGSPIPLRFLEVGRGEKATQIKGNFMQKRKVKALTLSKETLMSLDQQLPMVRGGFIPINPSSEVSVSIVARCTSC
jgi:hypothetical protein